MPSGFNIGPLTIHFYGILIMLGVIAGHLPGRHEATGAARTGNWSGICWRGC